MMKFVAGIALLCFVAADLDSKIYDTPDCTGTMKVEHTMKTDGTCYNRSHAQHDHYVTAKCTEKEGTIFVWNDDKCTDPGHNHTFPIGSCNKMPHRQSGSILATCTGTASNSDFEAYKSTFGKTYPDAATESRALECYRQNLKNIKELQSLNSTAEFGENVFTDQCYDDFLRERTMGPVPDGTCWKSPGPPPYPNPADKSKATDWRDKGYVNAVKDQKACGSCWAFSAVANMEASWFRKTGNLLRLSEQELVSCDVGGKDRGCNGGGPDTAFDWTIKNGGIALESDYPYTGKEDSCNSGAAKKHAARFSEFTFLDTQKGKNEVVLLAALQNEQPISIYIASTKAWHSYTGGILDPGSCGSASGGVNHCVAIVGYSNNGGKPYWIVRNSWGERWGESGYIRLAFNQNTCNMAECFAEYITAK